MRASDPTERAFVLCIEEVERSLAQSEGQSLAQPEANVSLGLDHEAGVVGCDHTDQRFPSEFTVPLTATGPGTAYVFAWTGSAVAASAKLEFAQAGSQQATLSLADPAAMASGLVTVGWLTPSGATAALAVAPAAS
jgi:hypothetical protein